MNLLRPHDPTDLEDGVRALLQRLADEVEEDKPAWDDLISRRPAVVVELKGDGGDRSGRAALGPPRARSLVGTAAAAAVIAAAVAGALVAGRTGFSGSSDPAAPATEAINAVSPGEAGFDAAAAVTVWATGAPDPISATAAYLATMGVPTDPSLPGAAAMTLRVEGGATTTAVVDWSLIGGADTSGGTVYLRSSAPDGNGSWSVVGAAAPGVRLGDVTYDGEELSFAVVRTSGASDQLAVGVWVDGRPASLGGPPVPQAAAGTVSLGEALTLAGEAGARQVLEVPAAPDAIVTLRAVDVVEGQVRSVTQMAVALPDADPAAAETGAYVAVGGEASASVDGGAGTVGGEAGGALEAGVEGAVEGVEEAVDEVTGGGTPPTLPPPSLPPLLPPPGGPTPTLLPPPGGPTPTLLPAPGSPPDLVP